MTKCTILGVVVILSTASYRPNEALGIASAPLRRREEVLLGRGTADAMALPPSFHLSMVGKETTTRPWTSPVGHRQPRVADVPASTSVSQQSLDQEDANIDRLIGNVCRGC